MHVEPTFYNHITARMNRANLRSHKTHNIINALYHFEKRFFNLSFFFYS